MTCYCPKCRLYWTPPQTLAGSCIKCQGGTIRTNHAPNADAAYEIVMAERASDDKHDRFEEFYEQRERDRPDDAWKG